MAEFEHPPVLTLETMEDVRTAIAQPRHEAFTGLDKWRVKSVWLISLIDEIEASGRYPYNADVARLADERLGNPVQSHEYYSREGTTLSLLVYNAQKYRRSDQLEAQGFKPFTREMLQDAYELGKEIETAGGTRLKPRLVSGTLYAFKPRERKRHLPPQGQAVRLVDPGSEPSAGRRTGIDIIVAG